MLPVLYYASVAAVSGSEGWVGAVVGSSAGAVEGSFVGSVEGSSAGSSTGSVVDSSGESGLSCRAGSVPIVSPLEIPSFAVAVPHTVRKV